MKNKSGRAIILLLSLMLFGGCASTHMNTVPPAQRITSPEPGKALIYFARPSSFAGAIQATIFDEDSYIGTVSANTHVAYQANPGHHMFMIIAESADFMSADLEAGKTYYARVAARVGFWKARFSFIPSNAQHTQSERLDWVSSTDQVEINEKGLKWAKDNEQSIQDKKSSYLPKWNAKSEKSKQILLRESGT